VASGVTYTNRRARFDYEIEDTIEAGIALTGTEIKSVRAGGVDFRDAYASFDAGVLTLKGLHIPPYTHGSIHNHEPRRVRRLLLHARELERLRAAVNADGYTLVPTRLYIRGPWAKVELGLGKGKRKYDKRATTRRREAQREMDAAMKRRS
jgi:SsrA-binding protein